MTKSAALFAAVIVLTGCATTERSNDNSGIVRSRAPANYESAISGYFDLTGAPAERKLTVGTPEKSPCALWGGAGRHAGWVVPVVYDTSAPGGPARSPAAAAKPAVTRVSGSGTGSAAVSLDKVAISGARYFFWFSSDTISAVTRRPGQCP